MLNCRAPANFSKKNKGYTVHSTLCLPIYSLHVIMHRSNRLRNELTSSLYIMSPNLLFTRYHTRSNQSRLQTEELVEMLALFTILDKNRELGVKFPLVLEADGEICNLRSTIDSPRIFLVDGTKRDNTRRRLNTRRE